MLLKNQLKVLTIIHVTSCANRLANVSALGDLICRHFYNSNRIFRSNVNSANCNGTIFSMEKQKPECKRVSQHFWSRGQQTAAPDKMRQVKTFRKIRILPLLQKSKFVDCSICFYVASMVSNIEQRIMDLARSTNLIESLGELGFVNWH